MKTIETLNAEYNLWYCHYLKSICLFNVGVMLGMNFERIIKDLRRWSE